ncbi:hypothetical protein FSARC_598 [Fusarium sarcochroum]|uniref:Uncharacterized protein n=1 Tax=Fusarium sarcochroum TaxID=1208366 RepID=A0A8H4XG53_9HYPO|nr:hypothetical protein FSARC_598 [Fusarium sarcochroum]
MSFQDDDHGHLDTTTGREVVYFHACPKERHRDKDGEACPGCRMENQDTFDSENEPLRHDDHPSAFNSFASGPFGGGATSVTTVSGSIYGSRGCPPSGYSETDPFQELPSNVMRDIELAGEGNRNGGGRPPQIFAPSSHYIFSRINQVNALHGKPSYGQEEFVKILAGLRKTNPQCSAAPLATEEAPRELEQKPVNEETLGPEGKA